MLEIMLINSILLNICMNNSFMDAMAADWTPVKKKGIFFGNFKQNPIKQKGKYNKDFTFNQQSFFEDWDKDGVMNGIDCQPRNRKKQESFPAIQSSATNYFKIPQQSIKSSLPSGAISSGVNQNISLTKDRKSVV